jgi:glycosyltransferase domain-containing protein
MRYEMKINDKYTIIVPTYQRQEHVVSLVDYWEIMGVRVIIVDGSPSKLSNSIVDNFPNNIEYYHLPQLQVEDRLIFAGNKVVTEYVIMMSDDECLSLKGIEACVRLLDADKSISSCGGAVIGFRQTEGLLHFKKTYSEQIASNALSDSFYLRMIESLGFYSSRHVFAVNRTDNWLFAWQCGKVASSTGRYGQEIVFEMISSALGKSITLPIVYLFRNYSNAPIREIYPNIKYGGTISKSFVEWNNDPNCLTDKRWIINELAKHLSKKLGLSLNLAKFAIQRAFLEFTVGQGHAFLPCNLFKPSIFSIKELIEYRNIGITRADPAKRAIFDNLKRLDESSVWDGVMLNQYLGQNNLIYDMNETEAIEAYLTRVC